MAMRKIRAGGGKPPVFKPTKIVKQGGVKKKFTGKGASGTGLGLGGKGRKITKKGYTGKGAYGYGQGNHGVASPKPPKKSPRVGRPASGGTVSAPKPPKATGGKPPVAKKPGLKKPKRTIAPAGGKKPRGVKNPHKPGRQGRSF